MPIFHVKFTFIFSIESYDPGQVWLVCYAVYEAYSLPSGLAVLRRAFGLHW